MPEPLRQTAARGPRIDRLPLSGIGAPPAPMGHALAWFDGHLYLAPGGPPGTPARIFRRDGATGQWVTVHESPMVDTPTGPAPRESGIRAMTVFQGSTDAAPCLYCGTISDAGSAAGGQILRSTDGLTFSPAPPLLFGAPALGGFAVFGPWLAMLPRGAADRTGLHPDRAARGTVPQVAQDPGAGFWTPADELARATGWHTDPANLAIAALAVAHGALYAATTNPTRGFELWRTRGETTAPFHWEKVLDRGAHRFAENPSVAAMTAFDGDLWIGTESRILDPETPPGTSPGGAAAGPEGGLDPNRIRERITALVRPREPAPPAAELMRLRADGSWDIVVGSPRFTPDGLKVPLAALGPGFGDPGQIAISALAVHAGRLYAGTRQIRPGDPGAPNRISPAGAALWCSADGQDWTLLPAAEQAGETGCIAVESLCPTPEGLVIGLRRDVAAGLAAELAGWAGGSLPAARAEPVADEVSLLRLLPDTP
jgi:hypothetical protein